MNAVLHEHPTTILKMVLNLLGVAAYELLILALIQSERCCEQVRRKLKRWLLYSFFKNVAGVNRYISFSTAKSAILAFQL